MPKPVSVDPELLQLQMMTFLARSIETACAVGLPEAIPTDVKDAVTVQALAKRTNLHAPFLYRLLRALAANGYFTEHSEQRFTHNERSAVLRTDHPTSQREAFMLNGFGASQRAWEALPAALRDGKGPFEHAHGVPLFAYLGQHADMAEVFNNAMVSHTRPTVQNLLASDAHLSEGGKFVDVGGGLGQLTAALLKAEPKLQGAVFDLPTLRGPALDYLSTQGVKDRAEFIAGSFLEKLPEGFDTYMIKNCLWNWGDSDTVQILRNFHRAMGDKGRFLIIENLITKETAPMSTLMDVMMLVMPNGRARTQEEYVDMASQAKLRLNRSMHVGMGISVLEFRRA